MGEHKRKKQSSNATCLTLAGMLGIGAMIAVPFIFDKQKQVKPGRQQPEKNQKQQELLQVDHVTFDVARNYPHLRSQYVNQLESLADKYPYVERISYQPSARDAPPNATMAVADIVKVVDNPELPISIEVYPRAFSVPTENDFLDILVDHEIQGHARLITGRHPLLQFEHYEAANNEVYYLLWMAVSESLAYYTQLGGEYESSSQGFAVIRNAIYMNYCEIIDPIYDDKIDPGFLRRLRVDLWNPRFHSTYIPDQKAMAAQDGKFNTPAASFEIPDYVRECDHYRE